MPSLSAAASPSPPVHSPPLPKSGKGGKGSRATPEDFTYLKVLGKGSFGKVRGDKEKKDEWVRKE